jgi:hypothetical protein
VFSCMGHSLLHDSCHKMWILDRST